LDLAVDGGGNVYVTGFTTSTDYPMGGTEAGFDTVAAGGGLYDGFVTRLNSAGSGRVWSTYLGGTLDTYLNAIAVTGTDVLVTGLTGSNDYPALPPGVFDPTPSLTTDDAFVTRITPGVPPPPGPGAGAGAGAGGGGTVSPNLREGANGDRSPFHLCHGSAGLSGGSSWGLILVSLLAAGVSLLRRR
jgi:hypothetical protein